MSYLKELQKSWNWFGQNDPLWAVNSLPGKRNNRWDKTEFFQTGKDEIDDVIGFAATLNYPIKGERALDFGCGVGRLTQALAPYFQEVYGVDIAISMIEQAREFCPEGLKCKFFLNQKDDLSQFDSGSFDFIYSNITLQHIRPEFSYKYIQEFMRILRPGGLMVFQLPEKMAFNFKGIVLRLFPRPLCALLFKLKNNCPVPMEMHCFSRKNVENLVIGKLKGKIIASRSAWGGKGMFFSTLYYVAKPNSGENSSAG